MSCYFIYVDRGVKMMRPVCGREEYLRLRDGGEQVQNLKRIREGEVGLKAALVQMNYSCLPNADGTLKGSRTASCSVGMDVDFKAPDGLAAEERQAWLAERMAAVPELVMAKREELGLLMLERSATKGYHLVFRRRPELSQEENLKWASELLGVKYDAQAKDITRVFFTTTAAELIYLDDGLFLCSGAFAMRPQGGGDLQSQGAERITNPDTRGSRIANSAERCEANSAERCGANSAERCEYAKEYHGIPFTDILKRYWQLNNNGFEPVEGDRDTLTFQLASDLRHICGRSFEWLDQVIPCYNGFPLEEKRQKIRNALQSKYEGFPLRLRNVLDSFRETEKTEQPSNPCQKDTPPEMPPKKLPALIKLLTSRTPDIYKAAVAHAVFPPLATHLCDVRFRYTDNVEHEATLMNCLMAGTGSGKGCIDEPIRHIMADIKRRDTENLRREAEWKKDCQKKGANKDKQVRPEGLVIQMIDPDMTKPALVTRMDEAEGHFVYVKLNELDLFEQLRGQTGKQHFQLMCLAFDPGAEYGQTRIGTQSVTARPVCRFNWNACTTVQKGRRFFSRVLTDGPLSRINFCTIPETEIGAEQPVYGQYDADFDEQLKPYIDNLVAARGLVECPQATRLAKKLQQECAEFARLSQSETYWNLSHRACVIAWLKACVLYVANGQRWERSIEDFVRWSLEYDLWCKMQFFGADIDAVNNEAGRVGRRGPRNLLELLSDVFTMDDARRVRRQQGLDTARAGNMVSTWKKRNYVVQMADGSFQKLRFKGSESGK